MKKCSRHKTATELNFSARIFFLQDKKRVVEVAGNRVSYFLRDEKSVTQHFSAPNIHHTKDFPFAYTG
jgi:hypothetical protein